MHVSVCVCVCAYCRTKRLAQYLSAGLTIDFITLMNLQRSTPVESETGLCSAQREDPSLRGRHACGKFTEPIYTIKNAKFTNHDAQERGYCVTVLFPSHRGPLCEAQVTGRSPGGTQHQNKSRKKEDKQQSPTEEQQVPREQSSSRQTTEVLLTYSFTGSPEDRREFVNGQQKHAHVNKAAQVISQLHRSRGHP